MLASLEDARKRLLKTRVTTRLKWGMQAHAGRVTKLGKVSGKEMGFS